MHLLLIAYEFPPIESAQGLRWGYLARELALLGHTVDVVTVDLGGASAAAFAVDGMSVRRVFAGPFVGGARRVALRSGRAAATASGADVGATSTKELAYRGLRRALDQVLIPDVRSEWLPWGLAAARTAIRARRPDVIIASHEPGVDLAIARRLSLSHHIPVLADLGDPMMASYSPRWRRSLDAMFERRWLVSAVAITVTTAATRDLLRARLPQLHATPIEVISQGFCPAPLAAVDAGLFEPGRFELLYTGTLYARFRNPQVLLEALRDSPTIRLTVIGTLNGIDAARLQEHPQVRYLGRMPHADVVLAQRSADMLVNFGNSDDVQVPGKLFEYFGAQRPILHIAQTHTDPSSQLLRSLARGVPVAAEREALSGTLTRLGAQQRPERDLAFDLSPESVAAFAWPRLAQHLAGLLAAARDAGSGAGRLAAATVPRVDAD